MNGGIYLWKDGARFDTMNVTMEHEEDALIRGLRFRQRSAQISEDVLGDKGPSAIRRHLSNTCRRKSIARTPAN